MSTKAFMKGNEIIAEAAIRAGLKLFAGYPITPQSELLEYMSFRMPQEGREFIQAESELAAISMVYGASVAGARTMTATSGPGLSLMAETLSHLAISRLPSVIVDVQRAGGNITPEQSDYNFATKGLGHNGMRGLVYAPYNLQETADIVYEAFNKADQYNVPVMIMVDGMIGQMMESVELPDQIKELPRQSYIPPTGCKGRAKVLGRNQGYGDSKYKTAEDALEALRFAYSSLYKEWVDTEVIFKTMELEDADYIIIAYGSAARICIDAIKELRKMGIKVGMFRPISLFPFPEKQIAELNGVKGVLTVEMAMPTMLYQDVSLNLDHSIPHSSYVRCGGNMIDSEGVVQAILNMERGAS